MLTIGTVPAGPINPLGPSGPCGGCEPPGRPETPPGLCTVPIIPTGPSGPWLECGPVRKLEDPLEADAAAGAEGSMASTERENYGLCACVRDHAPLPRSQLLLLRTWSGYRHATQLILFCLHDGKLGLSQASAEYAHRSITLISQCSYIAERRDESQRIRHYIFVRIYYCNF